MEKVRVIAVSCKAKDLLKEIQKQADNLTKPVDKKKGE